MLWYVDGICMVCHKDPIKVRHINLYPVGSEGLLCCRPCEDEILEFIRGKQREAVIRKKIKYLRQKEKRDGMENTLRG